MAGTLISSISNHIGTAAERAAMPTTALLLGSEWKETDTGIIYYWDGTTWIAFGGQRDALFAIPVTIDVAHHEIHEGESFHCDVVDITLASAATMILAFKAPSGTKRVHMVYRFITLTGGHVEIIRGPTWDNQTGTKKAITNDKDESGMASSGILEDQAQASFVASDNMIENPDSVAGGTVIRTIYAFGQKNQFAAAAREVAENVLRPDTQYAVKFISDAASNKAQMILDWYEHTDQ